MEAATPRDSLRPPVTEASFQGDSGLFPGLITYTFRETLTCVLMARDTKRRAKLAGSALRREPASQADVFRSFRQRSIHRWYGRAT